ncbi:AAA family ATPase [Deinococcus aquiradiocola]|uniref:ATPase n=1 Tax=Deinococcus aquiradiocola TaxID=393059 RepID=A0A917UUE5_9DEIO|nr:MoxR family ATPase [Deinococcus aquiradiocola]GGJ86045.1 ATPase [Deinococcus aquiradiocola]
MTPQLPLPDLQGAFRTRGYVASGPLATALTLVTALGRPLLLEGPAGVGKTEAAKTLALALGTRLIRLQCYEGLDAQSALYEWNYPRQLLRLRLGETQGHAHEADLYGPDFLLRRPLLDAIMQDAAPVLLIDEVDRADDAFEAFLLELLAEWQITIPELGTVQAVTRPHVILTSNRARELSDALRRRCLYLWVDYPSPEDELDIIRARLPHIREDLARQVGAAVQYLRALPLSKAPGVAETLDWAEALTVLHQDALTPDVVRDTLGCVLKLREDQQLVSLNVQALVGAAMRGM